MLLYTGAKFLGPSILGSKGYNPSLAELADRPVVLGEQSALKDYEFKVNVKSVFEEPSSFNKGLRASEVATDSLVFTGQASMTGLQTLDAVTETALEKALDVSGDVTSPAIGGLTNLVVTKINGANLGEVDPTSGYIMMGNGDEWQSMSTEEITSVGTVETGTWEADPVQIGYGGTGLTSFAAGDRIFSSSFAISILSPYFGLKTGI